MGPHQAGGLLLNHCIPLSEKSAHSAPAWTLPWAQPVSEEPRPVPWNSLLTPLSLFRAPGHIPGCSNPTALATNGREIVDGFLTCLLSVSPPQETADAQQVKYLPVSFSTLSPTPSVVPETGQALGKHPTKEKVGEGHQP